MEKWGRAARLIGLGFFVGLCITGGVLGGLWLDTRFNTKPLLAIIGLVLGTITAFWGVYQMLIPFFNGKGTRR
jgi:ATP synthase protein I